MFELEMDINLQCRLSQIVGEIFVTWMRNDTLLGLFRKWFKHLFFYTESRSIRLTLLQYIDFKGMHTDLDNAPKTEPSINCLETLLFYLFYIASLDLVAETPICFSLSILLVSGYFGTETIFFYLYLLKKKIRIFLYISG